MSKKTIAIFGSTGSIGKNSLEVIKENIDKYQISVLTANNNWQQLAKQAKEFFPKAVCIANEKFYLQLKNELKDFDIEILSGKKSLVDLASCQCDLFISAIVGMASLEPTLKAIQCGFNIGMANKEAIVSGGEIILSEAKKSGSKIIPIDSEHNAIFQVFENCNYDKIKKITLTASGGPFWQIKLTDMTNISVKQAIKHPKWNMGKKISIDSATLMNKALEFIEAYRLFPVDINQIEVVLHPQAIIHGGVTYHDGSAIFLMSYPDMKIPISYAIAWPNRVAISHKDFNLSEVKKLQFHPLDNERFSAINLSKEVLKIGGTAPVFFNAANEVAVQKFINEEIGFLDIIDIIKKVLDKGNFNKISNIEDVILADIQARVLTQQIIN